MFFCLRVCLCVCLSVFRDLFVSFCLCAVIVVIVFFVCPSFMYACLAFVTSFVIALCRTVCLLLACSYVSMCVGVSFVRVVFLVALCLTRAI